MTRRIPLEHALLIGAGLSAALLAGCASTTPAPAVPAAAPAAAPSVAPTVTMAPIANPEHATPATRRESSPEPRERPAEASKRETAPSTAGPVHAGASPTQDLIRASRLRERGLEELNRGAVAHAVALLTEASHLAPGNVIIQRDLERAQRISRAVQAPH